MADDWGNDPVQSMSAMPKSDFSALMDKTFGAGKWKLTGGLRTPEREAELRKEGAQTVAPGKTSAHSLGTEEAPGAYDVVVDGVSPAVVAEKLKGAHAGFHKLYPEGASGDQGGHLHVEPYLDAGAEWGNDPVQHVEGPKADAPVPKKPTPRQSLLDTAVEPWKNAPGDIGHAFMEADRYAQEGLKKVEGAPGKFSGAVDLARKGQPLQSMKQAFSALGDVPSGLGQVIEGDLGALLSPITGAAHAGAGRPVERATGSKVAGQVAEDAVALAAPVAGEARLAGEVSKLMREEGLSATAARELAQRRMASAPSNKPNGLKAAMEAHGSRDPEHIAAVNRLKAAGVQPAEHQAAGGTTQRFVESAKSNPYMGEGVREAERKAGESFNRGLYNKVLEPLGEKVPDSFPTGRDGVKAIKTKMDREFEAVLPHVRVVMDKPTTDALAEIRTAAAKLGAPQEQQFEHILNQDVLHKIGPDGMDGRTFKSVESDLLRQARALKGAQDPNQQGLGRRLEDVVDVLRQDMIDHSPAKYKARLTALNSSYARFTRLEDAAARRQGGAGEITPQDLLAAVKKGDHTVRKGAFARGDALLQDFAEDADRVLSPKVRDSGTTERTLANRMLGGHALGATAGAGAGAMIGGGPGAAIGGIAGAVGDMAASRVTNALAHRVLSGASRTANTRNYLRAAQQRALAPRAAIPAAASALPAPGPQAQP
jgi:hypothetical protein